MPATSLVGVIPPIPAWIGNRFAPAVLKHCKCDRCGDVDLCAWKAVDLTRGQWAWLEKGHAPVPIAIRHLCAWCWIADTWDERAARARLKKRPAMTFIAELPP